MLFQRSDSAGGVSGQLQNALPMQRGMMPALQYLDMLLGLHGRIGCCLLHQAQYNTVRWAHGSKAISGAQSLSI